MVLAQGDRLKFRVMSVPKGCAVQRVLAGRSTDANVNPYSGVVLSSNSEIRQLGDVAPRLMQQDEPLLDPEFFLASVSKGWRPRVVAVYSAGEVVGILYTKERVISGIPTGVIFADGSLGGFLLGNPLHRKNLFRVAMERLLASPRIRGARLRVLRDSDEFEAVKGMTPSKSLDINYSEIKHNDSKLWKYHAHLPLTHTYDQFLKGLGTATRHNFRYYRRRFEASGHSFVEHLSADQLRPVALDFGDKSKSIHGAERLAMEGQLNLVATARRPLAIGLKHANREWLGVLGGWYQPGGAILCFQCNSDRNFGSDSLSVVLRGYLIELLIRQGLQELVIWGDTVPPLSRYVTYVPTIGVRLDPSAKAWRVARRLISAVGPWLPGRLALVAQWVA